jgi:GNAT superfamily N-acetyltransferase
VDPLHAISILSLQHGVDSFDSGAPELDGWLKQHAHPAMARDTAKVYVVVDDNDVVAGYCAVVVAATSRDSLSKKSGRGLPADIPSILLAKLAVDERFKGRGIGKALLGQALRVSLQVRERVGVRLFVADARDEAARAWYELQGMEHLPGELKCYARLRDLDASA